jgi:hypothetical protein
MEQTSKVFSDIERADEFSWNQKEGITHDSREWIFAYPE